VKINRILCRIYRAIWNAPDLISVLGFRWKNFRPRSAIRGYYYLLVMIPDERPTSDSLVVFQFMTRKQWRKQCAPEIVLPYQELYLSDSSVTEQVPRDIHIFKNHVYIQLYNLGRSEAMRLCTTSFIQLNFSFGINRGWHLPHPPLRSQQSHILEDEDETTLLQT